MKKSYKFILVALISFFVSSIPVFARNFTKEELGNAALTQYTGKSVGYIYVIGEYAFTSQHTLTTQDVMLAARSIKANDTDGKTDQDEIYKKMTMFNLTANRDPLTGQTKDWTIDKVFGESELSESINIKYIDYQYYAEKSEATISVDVDSNDKYKQVLEESLNFKTDKYYGKNSDNQKKLTFEDGKISGLLLKNNDVTLNDEDKKKNGDYFFAYSIDVPNAGENTTIKIKNLNGETNIGWKDFDVQKEEGKTPGIVLLTPIDREKFKENSKITIEVDVDGEGKEYEKTTYEIDLSGLTFQEDSTPSVSLNNPSAEDKKILESWGYDSGVNQNLQLSSDDKLTGDLIGQALTEDKAFGKENKNGYYFDFKFTLPQGVNKDEVKISQIKDSSNKEIVKSFNSTEFDEEGNLTILFRFPSDKTCESNSENCKLYYSLDYDGDGERYLPTVYTLDYSGLKFLGKKINYNYKDKDGIDKTEEIIAHENDEIKMDVTAENNEYRVFDGWYDSTGKKVENIPTIDETVVNLTAHWNVNVDKFISDVIEDLNSDQTTYSDNFNKKFELKQDETNKNKITIKIKEPSVSLTELAETSIPGSIAYILNKGEIEDITLTVGDQNVTFNKEYASSGNKTYQDNSDRKLLTETGKNLKTEIVKGAKDVFDKELSGNESTATLDQLEFDNESFTIKIGNTDGTVKLVDSTGKELTTEDDKTYTFEFDSDFVVVNQDENLGANNIEEALVEDKDYSNIYIDGNIDLDKPLDIDSKNEVTIQSLEKDIAKVSNSSLNGILMTSLQSEPTNLENEQVSTIKAKDNSLDYVIDVKSGNVTLKDIKITGGKKAELVVENGANVNVENVDVSGEIEPAKFQEDGMNAAIIVKGNLTAKEIKNANESYVFPTVATVKDDASQKNSEQNVDAKITVENMYKNNKYSVVDRSTGTNFDSIKGTYEGEFYYNNADNLKIYYIAVIDPTKGTRPSPYSAFKVYYQNEKIDYEKIGYKVDETVSSKENETDKKFKGFKLSNSSSVIDNQKMVQEILTPNAQTVLTAYYE